MDAASGPNGAKSLLGSERLLREVDQCRRVLRYEPDRHAYQYEKELEDFIHSRQLASENGESEGPTPATASRGPQRI